MFPVTYIRPNLHWSCGQTSSRSASWSWREKLMGVGLVATGLALTILLFAC
jgi:hypothetical protein